MRNEGTVTGSTFFQRNEQPRNLPSAGGRILFENRILILSREKDTRSLLGTLLRLWGYRTDECDCFEQSMAFINSRKPNLILIDSPLPFETHLDIIRQIRDEKSSKSIPIVVISGFSQPKFRDLSLGSGADYFFVKPVNFDALEKCLKKNIEQYRETLYLQGENR